MTEPARRDPLLTALDRRIDERTALFVGRLGARYARPRDLGLSLKAARAGAWRGDYRVVKVGKFVLVDIASFEAHATKNEIVRPDPGGEPEADDPFAGLDPSVVAAFRRAAAGEEPPPRRTRTRGPR